MNASLEHPVTPAASSTPPGTLPPAAPPAATLPPAAAPAAPAPAAPPLPAAGPADPGGAPPGTRRLQHKSPALACLLSAMPGVGQIYVGYYKLGFIHNVVFGTAIAFLSSGAGPLTSAVAIFLAFFFIYNVVDAGRRATLYNLAVDGVAGIDLPSMNVSLPSFGGSLAGGAALMAVGAILLSNTLFGVPLDWIESWWPVAPIVVGVWLFAKAIQERRSAAALVEDDAGSADASGSESDPRA